MAGEPTRCLFAFFAGWDLSDIEGYAFGPADEDCGEFVVWLVENGMARRVVCGTFTEWLTGSPYPWGLVDSGGDWLIPLGKRFQAVRPFRKGVAEVVLNDSTTSYAGPWTRIRTDGSIVQ